MADIHVLNVPGHHPLNKLSESLKQRLVSAQQNTLEREFTSAADLCSRAFADLKIAIESPAELKELPPVALGDQTSTELTTYFSELFSKAGIPRQAIPLHAANASHRVQLLRAFVQPDEVIKFVCERVIEKVGDLPTEVKHVRRGKNPGDVLDPFILAAAQILLCAGDFEQMIWATVAHKGLMVIEGMLGHLHEDVLGAMRGNFRAPEPRGEDQETLDPFTNPFPGADVVQPPLVDRPLRFHQMSYSWASRRSKP